MRKFASFEIVETLLPNHKPIFDLLVKNTANQRIPYRIYNGTSFDELILTAIKYHIDLKSYHDIKVYNFWNGNDGIVSYTNSPVK